ncbi:MAG: phasin family protein [Pseudomonadales bacterium]
MADNDNTANPFGNLFGQFQVPGLDVQSMMEESRKDWEALQAANQAAMEGWQQLAQKQQELAQKAMQQWQADVTAGMGSNPQENAQRVQESVQAAMANMQELANSASEAQNAANEILRKRFEENLKRLSGGS